MKDGLPSFRGKEKVIQIEDVEHEAHSSERRDQVESLRESKVPLNILNKTENLMS